MVIWLLVLQKKINQVNKFKLEDQILKVYEFNSVKCFYKPVFKSSEFNYVFKTSAQNYVFLTTELLDCETMKTQLKVSVFNGTIVEIVNSDGGNLKDIEELPSTIFHKNDSQFEIIDQFSFDNH